MSHRCFLCLHRLLYTPTPSHPSCLCVSPCFCSFLCLRCLVRYQQSTQLLSPLAVVPPHIPEPPYGPSKPQSHFAALRSLAFPPPSHCRPGVIILHLQPLSQARLLLARDVRLAFLGKPHEVDGVLPL